MTTQEQQQDNIVDGLEEAQRRLDLLLKKCKSPKSSIPQVDLRSLNLKSLPTALTEMPDFYTRVTKLNVRGNSELDLSLLAPMASNLVELNASDMNLTEIPQILSQFSKLTKLILSENKITEIPQWMLSDQCKFRDSLTMLSLESNQVSVIPNEISSLKKLQHFQMHDNLLTHLPSTLLELDLQNLTISKNKLREDSLEVLDGQPNIDDKYLLFKSFPRMRYFGCHMNKNLKYLPEEIGNWKDLEFLCLSKCSLEYIPLHVIAEMKNLKHLNLNGNNIGDDSFINPHTNEPVSITSLKNLTELDLRENNRLTFLPTYLHKNVVKENFPKLKRYRHSFAECVVPNQLYIGDKNSVLKKKHMEDLKITHILSVIDDVHLPELPHDQIQRLHINILDEEHVDIGEHFDNAIKFIEDALLQPNAIVLVHCVVGKSRSASCVLAYLMKNHKMTYDQAFTYLNERRSGNIAPNPSFVTQLRQYEEKLKSLRVDDNSTTPGTQLDESEDVDHAMLQHLKEMGIEENIAKEALVMTNFSSFDNALNYIQNTQSQLDSTIVSNLFKSSVSSRKETPTEELKLVLVIRDDIGMGKGKIAAQASHAAVGAYRQIIRGNNDQQKKWLAEWEDHLEPKIAVRARDEAHMLELERNAKELGLNTCSIIDAGRTQVAPNTRTVMSIGPAPVSLINQVTGKLRLL